MNKRIITVFSVLFVVFIMCFFGMLFTVLTKVERADYYNLSGDEISTFTKVNGCGKIRESQGRSTPEMEQKRYVYGNISDYSENISAYQQYLKDHDGFIEMKSEGVKMTKNAAILVKESSEEGKLLIVQVLAVPSGVEITLQKISGELTED